MSNIKVLDCTLRDGGYVNNWDFKYKNIKKIINNLEKSQIEFIECGFLKNIKYNPDQSLFDNIEHLEALIQNDNFNTKYTLMINYGEIPIDNIKQSNNKNIIFRVAFKKEQKDKAIEYSEKLKQLGYELFINPMHTNTYSCNELKDLTEKINRIKPYAFTIVDTIGCMHEKDISKIFNIIDDNLESSIALCFHSHNNLQLSFSNAQCLMNLCHNRELIIDSTVFGMGRGAGNLRSELLTKYINDNYCEKYNVVPILKIIDEQINYFFSKSPWGYSVPYYLAAVNNCHPDYAKYLINKQKIPVDIIDKLLKAIPDNKKSVYDELLIKKLYNEELIEL